MYEPINYDLFLWILWYQLFYSVRQRRFFTARCRKASDGRHIFHDGKCRCAPMGVSKAYTHACVYINVHRLTLARSRFLFPLYFPSQGIDSQGVRAGRPVFNHFTPPLSRSKTQWKRRSEALFPALLFCSLSLAWKNELFSVADFANPTPALQFIFALANWRALLGCCCCVSHCRFWLKFMLALASAAGACRLWLLWKGSRVIAAMIFQIHV